MQFEGSETTYSGTSFHILPQNGRYSLCGYIQDGRKSVARNKDSPMSIKDEFEAEDLPEAKQEIKARNGSLCQTCEDRLSKPKVSIWKMIDSDMKEELKKESVNRKVPLAEVVNDKLKGGFQ